jgi:hypothetical protein
MLDVHPAHHAAHSWRDFFIHIATIVLGLLIAVSLEQTVEYFHHRHQRQELYAGILSDAHLMLSDVDQNSRAYARQIEDLNARIQQVQQAISLHRKLDPPAYRPALPTNTIKIGNIEAATSSGLLQLLPQDEVVALTEPEVGVAHSEALRQRAQDATRKRLAFEQRFQASYPAGTFDFSAATPAQLDQYLGLLLDERVLMADLQDYLGLMRRGTVAFIGGQRNIDKVREAEEGSPASPSR